jgi:hypothetical protein
MRGSSVLRIVAGLVIALALVGLGAGIYQAGIAQGVADAGRVPAGAVVPYAGYGYGFHPFGFGFGLFGLIWFAIMVLVFVTIVRFAFGFGRRSGRRGWGPGWGAGGPGGPTDPGSGGAPWMERGAWSGDRRRQLEELHRRLHEEAAGQPADAGRAPSAGDTGGTPPER